MSVPVSRPHSILPFSGHVGDVDYRPVQVVPKSCSVADASIHFAAADIDYIVIHDNRIPVGVVSKLELIRSNMSGSIKQDELVAELMTTQVVTVQKGEPVLESLMFMIKHNIDFLLIMDGKQVMGIVGQQDWLSLQSQYPTELVQKITTAGSIERLAEVRESANEVIWHNFQTKGDAVSLTGVVTVINDAITRGVITLALGEMAAEGRGESPCSFAWIGMGSEGRMAQTITTDQDNGLVYANVPEAERETVDAWFAEFAEKVVAGLEACGFDRCAGNAMATNPDLRGTVEHWHKLFERIITKGDDEALFEACIYFDFRCLFGKSALVDDIKDHLMKTIDAHPFFLRHLVETTVQGSKPPIRDFRWKLWSVTGINPPLLDIKKSGLLPLDSSMRVLALLDRVKATPTLVRLRQCLENGRMPRRLAEDVRKAFDFLLRLRFKLEFTEDGPKLDHTHELSLNSLPPAQARYLIDALGAVLRLQEFVYQQVMGRKMHWSIA